ncbi:MAG: single-stranded DNA-binding protein [Opitutales bacterium]|nr:single-stranded DNA-binding protein [Opitutales bacterium]
MKPPSDENIPPVAQKLVTAAEELADAVDACRFGAPVHTVYNPLRYAWPAHRAYIRTYGATPKRIVFLGMNPGPWGMAQTGVPFGEIPAVRDWMGIDSEIGKPAREHPKRPIEGFACKRSEVSGRRLWGLFAARFGTADAFFADHFVANYCPLVFMAETGANITPDKLPAAERAPLEAACDRHLANLAAALRPTWVIGVGAFASRCAARVAESRGLDVRIGTLLHPSPASPVANREWPERPLRQMQDLGLWA